MSRTPFASAVGLVLAASIILSSGCKQKPQPERRPKAKDDTLPTADLADANPPLPTAHVPQVNVAPSVPAYAIEPDLSNVEDAAMLSELPGEHRDILARNGFLVSTSRELEMYEVYLGNEAPFVTADSVFHAYHILLSDTLSGLEQNVLEPALEALTRGAHERAAGLCAGVPAELARPATKALAFWATAHRLLDPEAELEPSVRDEVTAEVDRVTQGTFVGTLPGEQRTRDYTVYVPSAAYSGSEQMRRYFRCNRFLTLTPLEFQTNEGVRTCALVTRALLLDDDARSRYEKLCRVTRFLAGEPEDVSPFDVLNAMRSVYGESISPSGLADEQSVARLREELGKLKHPSIADQPQDTPGAHPAIGWGLRILAPGVSIRAQAFQRLGERNILPSGEDMAHLLGNAAFQSDESQAAVLAPAREMLDRAVADYAKGLDLHTSALVVLSALSKARGDGYPGFMNTPAWALKTANTQLGAWSQVEHDVSLYAKDTAQYLCTYITDERFHGYVEPVPQYYAALAALVHRTRVVFDSLDAFEPSRRKMLADGVRVILQYLAWIGPIEFTMHAEPERLSQRRGVNATKTHYKILERILLKLKTMSQKELENKAFDASEIRLLKSFGERLKYLAFNESNSPHVQVPMSTIVRIAREYSRQEGLYVGTGRPLEILVIVPWQGRLHWCTGATYSYYEFMHPLSDPITDERWKNETSSAFVLQARRPWLCRFDIGLRQRTLSRDVLAAWLPEETTQFGELGRYKLYWEDASRLTRRPLDPLGFIELDAEAIALVADAFAGQHHRQSVRYHLYFFLQDSAKELRKKTALLALSNIISEVNAGASIDSADYAVWLHLSLRLLKDQADDPDVKTKLRQLEQLRGIGQVLKGCVEDPELRPLLQTVSEDSD